jgi:hypothetical protein
LTLYKVAVAIGVHLQNALRNGAHKRARFSCRTQELSKEGLHG